MNSIDDLLKKCEELKVCSRCHQSKFLFEFSKSKANKDGLQYHCRSCDKEYQQKRRSQNSESLKEYSKKYLQKKKQNFEFRLQMLLNASKQRALSKNREHTITLEDIKEAYPIDNKCPVFGFDLEFGDAGFREKSPSIDRIDSSKGYTKDNIQIISWKANRLKSSATTEDLEILLAFLKQGE